MSASEARIESLRDERGQVIGHSSITDEPVPLLGNRRLWVYHSHFTADPGSTMKIALANEAHRALNREFVERGEGPIGLCLLVDDGALIRDNPHAIWPGTSFMYAGYLDDGRQVRVAYFEGARI
jgi:hypothetical protein